MSIDEPLPAAALACHDSSAPLRLESRYRGVRASSGRLELDFAQRAGGGAHASLASGEKVALCLPPGTVLRGGHKLVAHDGRIIEVVAAPEPLTEVRCADALELARAAYHLGSRQVPVELGEGWLRLRADPALEAMLAELGAELVPLRAPFEPEMSAAPPAVPRADGNVG